jgi:two-component system sensor histidine kinase AgrC
MLAQIILNIMDTFNIMYVWTILSNKDDKIIKMLLSVLVSSSICTIMEQLSVNFIFIYIAGIIIIKIFYKDELKDIIVGYFLILYIYMILELALTLIIKEFTNDYIIQGFIIETIIMSGVIIVSKLKLLNQYAILKYNTFEKKNNDILIYFVLTFSIYIIVFKFVWNNYNYIIQNNLFITVVISCALIVCKVVIYLYMIKTIKEEEKLKISNQYNPVIDEIVQEIKQRQHDFINYKNTIRGIVNVVDGSDIKKLINNYINDEDIYDDKINSLIYIENVIIRSIIYRNMCRFKKYNINFEYEIENKVLDNNLTYNEISNVLNNLLNNAFEEVVKEECIKKNIRVEIFNRNKTSHLIVKNQVASIKNIDLNEIFTRGYSTKGIGTRGYGLHNVQAIVNSHKGNIKINVQDEKIIFDIFFN